MVATAHAAASGRRYRGRWAPFGFEATWIEQSGDPRPLFRLFRCRVDLACFGFDPQTHQAAAEVPQDDALPVRRHFSPEFDFLPGAPATRTPVAAPIELADIGTWRFHGHRITSD